MKMECWCARPTERWAAWPGPTCARRAWKVVAAWWEYPHQADGHSREPGTEGSFFCFLCRGERYELDALSVLLDACHYAGGKLEGCPACGTVNARLRARAHCLYKGLQFRMQRFSRGRWQLLIGKFGPRSAFFRGDAQGV